MGFEWSLCHRLVMGICCEYVCCIFLHIPSPQQVGRVKYHVGNESIHDGFLVLWTPYGSLFYSALWLTDPFKVILFATCSACLTPCRTHSWSVAWPSFTMLESTATLTCVALGLYFHHDHKYQPCPVQAVTLEYAGPLVSVAVIIITIIAVVCCCLLQQ